MGSRKLWLSVFTMGLMFFAWLLCGRPASLFGELCMALIATASGYKGSNIMEKWLDTKKPAS